MANVDIRTRGHGKRQSVVVVIDGRVTQQYWPGRGETVQHIVDRLHERITGTHGGVLVSTSADETVLTADALDWSKLDG